ncbi:MAG: DUF3619 family protein [Burkholderiales bacterium]
MNEQEFARKVAQNLDEKLDSLPASTVYKLEAFRREALSRVHAAPALGARFPAWKWAAPAMLVVLACTVYFLRKDSGVEAYELEAQMLADDLPIHAYLDEGFETWLQKTADD